MQAFLMSKELWILVDSVEPCPTSTDSESCLKWLKHTQKAAGELYLAVEQDQKSHFQGIQCRSGRLSTTFTCPNDQVLNLTPMMTSSPSENSQMNPCSLCARIDVAMQNIQDLQPLAFTFEGFGR